MNIQIDSATLNTLKDALDADMFRELIHMYITESNENMNLLINSVHAQDITTAIRAAHSIKGSSANVGALGVYECAKETEAFGKNGDVESMKNSLNILQAALSATCEEITHYT